MSQTIQAVTFIEEYSEWLKHESTIREMGEWREVTFPFLDQSNDRLCFYMRAKDGMTSFTDDGYTMAMLNGSGITPTGRRLETMTGIVRRFGATLEPNGEITLETDGSRPDALNRFVQALTDVQAMNQIGQHKVAAYFMDDVAAVLDRHDVYYTTDISVHGASGYEHSFDFLFQRSANHPTRFCQAPNRLDRNMAERIIFAWNDTEKDAKRAGSKLYVIGDDRERGLNESSVQALENYGIATIPFSMLPSRAMELAS
ncbi:DUF1829 domain-containing protein [Bifidobacterium felsineum]|uniref:DUF1829 domain-containing protein n=1 Tax=Bifidobacterium felsineum TaxID=2045440 RepID=UPI001BDC88E9|nr:DUF1829 domain-containing protein [Bifidobacterium felsineum]MBT1164546.1 DUF1829 domain-containing protein [Bifidobacterium felsineum]